MNKFFNKMNLAESNNRLLKVSKFVFIIFGFIFAIFLFIFIFYRNHMPSLIDIPVNAMMVQSETIKILNNLNFEGKDLLTVKKYSKTTTWEGSVSGESKFLISNNENNALIVEWKITEDSIKIMSIFSTYKKTFIYKDGMAP